MLKALLLLAVSELLCLTVSCVALGYKTDALMFFFLTLTLTLLFAVENQPMSRK